MIHLRTLGPWKLTADDGSELRDVLAQPKRFALLAYLALARGFHRRDSLLAMFWPDVTEERGRNSLRQAVHHLRHALGAGVVVGRGDEELAVDDTRLWCDAAAFERAQGSGDLAGALELYRGDLLPGLFVPDAPGFERWLESERARLKGRAAEAGWALAEREAAQGNAAAAGHWARWAAALAPDDEVALRRLMSLLAGIGDRTGAARAYASFTQQLSAEWDARPSGETEGLLVAIRESRGQGARARAPAEPTPAVGATDQAPRGSFPAASLAAPAAGRRTRRLTAVAAIAVAAVLVALALWRRQAESAIPVDDNAVVTLPFTVSGDPALAYLRDGMADLLDARLDGAGGLRTVDPHAVQSAVLREPGAARPDQVSGARLSRQLGARLFIIGEIVASGGHLQLGAALYDGPGPTPISRAAVEGDEAHLFQLVDELAGQLLANRREGADTRLTRVAALTTGSLDALRAYVDGERAYRAGRYQDAADAFQRATTYDTSFALAWYRLAIARDWTGSYASAAITHAAAHASALAPREAMLVSCFYQYVNYMPDAKVACHVAVTQHPDDVDAWLFLAETLFHLTPMEGRSFTEAREAFERVLALDPGNPNALLHLERIAAAEARTAEVDSLARLYLQRYADADRALEVRTLRAFALHERAAEARVAAELARTGDAAFDVAVRGVTALVQDVDGAERLAPLYASQGRGPMYVARGRALDAELAMATGRWREAQRRLEALRLLDPDWALEIRALFATQPLAAASSADLMVVRDDLLRWRARARIPPSSQNFMLESAGWPQLRDYLLGLVSIRLGDSVAARGYAAALDRLDGTAGDSGLAGDYAHVVRAEIARQAGALRPALAQAEQIHFSPNALVMRGTLYAGAHERFLHAELLHAVGRDEEALRWYGSFPEPAGYDITYLAPASLRAGEIEERLGHRDAALAHFETVVRLWKDADPALQPIVAQARAALARLGKAPA